MLGLKEEFHLDAGEFNDVVIAERMRLGVQCFAIDHRKVGTLHMRDKKPLRPASNDCNLNAGLS